MWGYPGFVRGFGNRYAYPRPQNFKRCLGEHGSFWFIECNDLPQLERLSQTHSQLNDALDNAEFALNVHSDWKRHHKTAFQSKSVLSGKNEGSRNSLEGAHYGFLSARLTLATAFHPLYQSIKAMQALLKEFLQDDKMLQNISNMCNRRVSAGEGKPALMPYHLELYKMNVHYCTLLLQRAYEVLAHPDFVDCDRVQDEIPCSFRELLGARTIIAALPELPEPSWGNTLKGVLTWFGELLGGKTKMPWGPKKGGGGFPEATSIAFKEAGWNVERAQGPFEEPGDCDSREHYVLTAPQADSNKKTG